MKSMKRRAFMNLFPAVIAAQAQPVAPVRRIAAQAQPSAPVGRAVVNVLDLSTSFEYKIEALQGFGRTVQSSGPADNLITIQIANGFDVGRQVAEFSMPPVDPELLVPPPSYPAFLQAKSGLAKLWQETDRRKTEIRQFMQKPLKLDTSGSNIVGVLEYSAHRFQDMPGTYGLKVLGLYTDMIHDFHGLKTEMPPRERFPFKGVEVRLLFVPWRGAATQRMVKAWRDYFLACGAASFGVYDESQSLSVNLLPPSPVPRVPANPFIKKAVAK
jgi:hypothetical protein